jgi:hypothetical protein
MFVFKCECEWRSVTSHSDLALVPDIAMMTYKNLHVSLSGLVHTENLRPLLSCKNSPVLLQEET